MGFNVVGLIAIIVFYVIILMVGIWAGRKSKGKPNEGESEDIMLAGRDIGVLVGVFTMTATWVGGGYINGTAEMIYRGGLISCQAPVGYCLSLILGGLLFAEKMRTQGYVTMLDPFQVRYGERMGGLLFLPALMGEVFWSAAILSALGATLTVILNLNDNVSVISSAVIAVFYTFFGGLYAVAYTDVVQLFCIFIGLWICIPFALLTLEPGSTLPETKDKWLGSLSTTGEWLQWIDYALLLVFGGIPWQVYFQRVLSSRSAVTAKMLSYAAAFGCLVMAIPPILIGGIAKSTNWTGIWEPDKKEMPANYTFNGEIPEQYYRLVLPLVLQYLTPKFVAFIGLGAVSAAVMSSADSSILSAAAMFARNIWKLAIRPGASEKEVVRVMRFSVIMVGIAATIMALMIKSIYELWFLCADLVYVILFPQLLCVVYMRKANTYGAMIGYAVAFVMRIFGGEPSFKIPAVIHYPCFYKGVNYFPFRTFSMLLSLFCIVSVSLLTEYLFTNAILPPNFDFLECVTNIPHDRLALKPEVSSLGASTMSLANLQKNSTLVENGGAVNPLLLHPSYSEASGGHTNRVISPISDVDSKEKFLLDERVPLKDPKYDDQLTYESMLRD